MKKIITLALTGLALLLTSNSFAQVGFGTNLPDKSAAVDIVSSQRGLLIPRIDITNLNNAAPVTNPATSLFVYNKNTSTGVGFYYWDGNKWVKFVSGSNESTTSVSAGNNVTVTPDADPTDNNDEYTVSIKAGGTDGYVLVTEETSAGVFTTTWVDPATFVNNLVKADNGLAYDTSDHTVKLGGTLDKATTITTDAANNKTLAIKGLENLTSLGSEKVLIMDATGILKTTDIANLVNANAADLTAGTALEVTAGTGAGAVLKDLTIGVKDESITATQIATDAVNSDEIAAEAVTTAEISNGTVKAEDLEATTDFNQVLTTDATGAPTWVDQSILVSNNETLTALTQDDGTGVITYTAEDAGTSTAEIVSANTDNIITVGTDGGAFLDAAAVQGQQKTVTLVNGTNTTVTSSNNPTGSNNTEYKVNVSDSDIQAAQLTTEVTAGTGISVSSSTSVNVTTYEVAADLTTIMLDGDVTGAANATKVEAIQGVAVSSTPPTTGQVLMYDGANYVPRTATSTIAVDNGLNYDTTADKIQLGGKLTEATTITTDATTSKTLAITGLQTANSANSMVVVDNTTGVLSTIKSTIVTSVNVSMDVSTLTEYSAYVLKLTILADITAADVNITLPAASTKNKGQVINIKVDKTTGDHYVNIKKDAATTITYGSLPYQGWSLTSTGLEWVITGRY